MKVAVLLGGTSEERNVSIASGLQVLHALRDAGHEVAAIDTACGVLTASQEADLTQSDILLAPPSAEELGRLRADADALLRCIPALRQADIVFVALHGGSGEDGTVQALLDLCGIAYTGSGHRASANAMDKDISKRLFRLAGVPTPDWLMAPSTPEEIARQVGFPAVVKASKQGSTVGVSVVRRPEDVAAAIGDAYLWDDEVLIEAYVPGREFTVGILEDEPLAVGEIVFQGDIFDYASKYQQSGVEEIFPADLPEDQARRVQALALQAHRALKLVGHSRIDFRLDEAGTFWCIEANNLPGMTASSLLPQAAQAVGIGFSDLCDRICRRAAERARNR